MNFWHGPRTRRFVNHLECSYLVKNISDWLASDGLRLKMKMNHVQMSAEPHPLQKVLIGRRYFYLWIKQSYNPICLRDTVQYCTNKDRSKFSFNVMNMNKQRLTSFFQTSLTRTRIDWHSLVKNTWRATCICSTFIHMDKDWISCNPFAIKATIWGFPRNPTNLP